MHRWNSTLWGTELTPRQEVSTARRQMHMYVLRRSTSQKDSANSFHKTAIEFQSATFASHQQGAVVIQRMTHARQHGVQQSIAQ